MFLPSEQACGVVPNSTQPYTTAGIAADAAALAAMNASLINANTNWLGLLSRNWRSFFAQGPYVAMQTLNGQPDISNPASVASGIVYADPSIPSSSPVGVNLVPSLTPGPSNPTGSFPQSGKPAGRGVSNQDRAFVKAFNFQPFVKTYYGPLPEQGTPRSLTVGGANRALAVGSGRYPAGTPDSRAGYSCPPDASDFTLAGSGAAGTGITVLALLGLAAVGFWADHQERKRGKRS